MSNERNDGDYISRKALKIALDWIIDNPYVEFDKEIMEEIDEVPAGECRTCRHRDPEDKKCDCGEPERAGCPFPVRDDYFCKFYEKGGAENEDHQ